MLSYTLSHLELVCVVGEGETEGTVILFHSSVCFFVWLVCGLRQGDSLLIKQYSIILKSFQSSRTVFVFYLCNLYFERNWVNFHSPEASASFSVKWEWKQFLHNLGRLKMFIKSLASYWHMYVYVYMWVYISLYTHTHRHTSPH